MGHVILLVEDDKSISEMLVNYLEIEGFQVVCAYDGEEAQQKFRAGSFDLILLDLMLPKLNGMDFLKQIREESSIPILILSAKDGEIDKALGLGFGADDYITKPFSMIELVARIHASIRRATKYSGHENNYSNIIRVHEITLDIENMLIEKNGKRIKLTVKEWELVKLFFTNPKRVFTKEQIYEKVWQDVYYGDENIINVHMRRLREKIEDDPSKPIYLKTLWGMGYRLGEF
ncbi:putative transcriptional regulatory protein YcbL [Sporosarcina sp. NCCP-2222]|uniref:response regulator transcription factor n=1 Tax=Sporosarcina sp. NCCP-2222 TaxID=2935073 RepID=UPI002083BEB7|nr:response regulator transcription factor [Sporosarcina sp. NCCP-2222]GKV56331.1 putative transcriptional regulatory protein YcbL [Sporosarcina sp. NCCP-2222]